MWLVSNTVLSSSREFIEPSVLSTHSLSIQVTYWAFVYVHNTECQMPGWETKSWTFWSWDLMKERKTWRRTTKWTWMPISMYLFFHVIILRLWSNCLPHKREEHRLTFFDLPGWTKVPVLDGGYSGVAGEAHFLSCWSCLMWPVHKPFCPR